MANTLRFKRGLLAGLPSAAVGEPLFTTDTFDLYIGTASGTQKYQKFIASGTTSQLLRGDGSLLTMPIVLTSPSNGQVLKYNGTSWVNDSDAGITGSGVAGQVAYFTGATTQGGSNNLFWDASNNRLGIGTNVPTWSLDIATTGTTISRIRGGGSANQGAAYFVTQGGTNTTLLAIGDGSTMIGGAVNNAMIYVNGSPLSFSMGGTTQMTLTSVGRLLLGSTSDNGLRFQVTGDGYFSGSLGIGVSPTQKLNVSGSGNYLAGFVNSAGTAAALIYFSNTSGEFYIGNDRDNGAAISGTPYARAIWGQGAYPMVFGTNNIERMRLDASGNLGLGVVPSAWSGKSLQIVNSSLTDVASSLQLSYNAYFDGSNWRYITSAAAANYYQGSGAHIWRTAASGTAGNAITFTQAMTLDASGNLGIGTTNPLDRLHVNNGDFFFGNESNVIQNIRFRRNAATVGSIGTYGNQIEINGGSTLGAGHLAITNGGNVILGFTGSSTGEKLQVNGTMRVSGASTFGGAMTLSINQNAGTILSVSNTTSGTASAAYASFTSSNGNLQLGKRSATTNTYKILIANDSFIYNDNSGDIGILNDFATGSIKMAAGGSSTAQMTLDASGRLGIGITPSAATLTVYSTINDAPSTTNKGAFQIAFSTTNGLSFGTYSTSPYANYIQSIAHAQTAGSIYPLSLNPIGGAVLIGATTSTGESLQVNGTMRVSGASTLSGGVTLGHTGGVAITFPGGQAFRSNGGIFIDYGNGGTGDLVFRRGAGVTNTLTLAVADGAATFSSSVKTTRYLLTPSGTTQLYNIVDSDNTYAGSYVFQAGGGSAGYGGSIIAYGHSHASKPGWITAGISANSNGKFTVNTHGLGGGIDVFTVDANGAGVFSSSVTTTPTTGGTGFYANGAADYSVRIVNTQSAGTFYGVHSVLNGGGGTKIAGYFTATGAGTNYAAIFDGGNVGIGISTPAQKLDVTGSANSIQARFGNVAGRGLTIGTSAISGTNDAGVVFNAPTATDGTLVFQTSSTDRMTLNSSGLNVATAIAIGTTPDTNLPFKILKNINSTVGIRFENTSTGNVAYSAVQFGTDVTGGTKFANLVYSSSGITESGAYKQNGTSIINTGTGGLNLLAVDGTIRFFTSSSNGTLRAEIANDGFINHYTGTAPSTNLTDGYRQYSADITAGNAAPHFRTENGGIIKLYQQTTGVTSATYIGGAGTGLTDSDTFDGYTIAQIVKALRNAGLLA